MKPIFISEEEKQKIIQEFTASLSASLYEGEISFSKSYVYDEKKHDKAILYYTPEAFTKTVMLIHKFDSEVAWHALIRRGEEPNEFIIYDVIVYPQEVTGATVNTDDEGYAQFMISLTDEEAAFMHAQCHSHVNMGTTPSSTDKTHQESVLKMMNGRGFYVFQIWNKSLATTNFIYDFDNNIMYESKDIVLQVLDETWGDLNAFVTNAKRIVKTKYQYSSSYNSAGSYNSAAASSKPPYSWTPGANNQALANQKARKKNVAEDWDEEDIDYIGSWSSGAYCSGFGQIY